jgi:hypothetical protein
VTDVIVVIAPDGHIELLLGRDSRLLRERLGMTAWVALEALVFTAEPDGRGGVTVAASSRDLAVRLGVGKDRAAAALAVLRDAGLLGRIERRAGRSARFVAHRYEIRLPVSRSADTARLIGHDRRRGEDRHGTHDGARLFEIES